MTKRKREELTKGRKRKTDPIDLLAIAHLLRDGLGQPAFLASGQELQLQLWGHTYRQTQQQRRRLTVNLLADLDRLWPGALVNLKRFKRMHPDLEVPVPLVLSKPLERQRVRAILQHCPNPHHFLALGPDGIQAFFRQHLARCGSKTAQIAFNVVQQAPPATPSLG